MLLRGMASPPSSGADRGTVANQYAIDLGRPLPPVGGLAAFGVNDQHTGRTDLMAVQVQRQLPARPRALQVLNAPMDGLLTPVAYGAVAVPGSAEEACYAICLAPPGPSVFARSRPWPESELLSCVLRPVAHVLEQLQARGLTHRGIRLDNVFQSRPGQPVVLGTAWAAPPGTGQSALFEPPYSAMCVPSGRGDGSIADDVYALGVLLLCLALGRAPLADLDDASILRRKLELGTYTALADDERLPPIIGDLVRGMLAEDPEHRPTPTLLLDPASARGRRVAARPPRRAQRSIALAGGEVWDIRSLAHAMAIEPEQGLHALRAGTVVAWLRRGVGDALLAAKVEELVRHRGLDELPDDSSRDATLVTRAIAMIDPLAPLCWRGIALWPDAIGTAIAAVDDPDVLIRLEELVTQEEVGNWATNRPDRCDYAVLRVDARQHHAWLQQRGLSGGMARLAYLLNPLMPCSSSLMGGRWVAQLPDLLPALESTAGRVDHKQTAPVDVQIAAFISARLERRMENDLAALSGSGLPDAVAVAQLRALAHLQSRFQIRPVPALAAWLAAQAAPVLATWRNRERRTAIAERIQALVDAGYLAPMLAALDDPAARTADVYESRLAADELNRIDTELAQIASGARIRAAAADRLGQEIAAGFGLAALAAVLVATALG
jgi:eukaryotic-like serine/threonine-protein kinase